MIQRGEEKTNEIRCRFNSPSCHSAWRACPELQNPLSHLAKDKLLTGEKMPVWADERWRESTLPRHSSTVCNGHPNFRRARVNYSNMDSASSPSAPRRMTGWKQFIEEWKFSDPSFQPKEDLMPCRLIGLMQCASVLDWCYVNWFMIDSCV